jgi:hypothetical protein
VILVQIDQLLRYHQRQRGNSPMLDSARELLVKAQDEVEVWQRTALNVTDYEYAGEQVRSEKVLSVNA